MAEQNAAGWSTPYKFTGKELDDITGLYYFGARYYDPRISLWMSVDPLAEKYPGWSPYNYTMDNPVKFVDPDGMGPDDWVEDLKGQIYWDNNATSQSTTKKGETYLGKYYARNSIEWQKNGGYLRTIEFYLPDQTTQVEYENEFEMFRFPECGLGFQRYSNGANNEHYVVNGVIYQGDNYVNGSTAVDLFNTFEEFYNKTGTTIHYGDISAYNPKINLGHKTHFKGKSVDIHYFTANGNELIGSKSYKNADITNTNLFFKIAEKNGFKKNYSYGKKFNHSGNNNQKLHKNHLHIGK